MLLVEDSPLYVELLRETLGAQDPGMELLHRSEVWAAADVLLGDGAACVLLDLSLPDAVGLEGLRKLRSLAPDVPIVVLTARDDEEQAIAALKAGAQDYLPKDRADGEMISRAVRYAVERAELSREQEASHHAQALAAELQRTLMPAELPAVFGIELAARYVPGTIGASVGGDWYDVVHLPGGGIAVAIGDVVGRGSQAAALMGQLRTALRAYALDGHSPAEALARTDSYARSLDVEAMATALFMTIDPADRKVTLASAGHVPPLMRTAAGEARSVDLVPSHPLGAGLTSSYVESALALEPGATLVLYTDGLVESRRSTLSEGMERLARGIEPGPEHPEFLCDHILTEVTPAGAGEDDIALVALRFADSVPESLSLALPAVPESLGRLRNTLGRWLRQVGASDTEAYELTVAVGEAAANAIEHAYPPADAEFLIEAAVSEAGIAITVRDFGRWRPPRPDDQGRGLMLMEALCDRLDVSPGDDGTTVTINRRLEGKEAR